MIGSPFRQPILIHCPGAAPGSGQIQILSHNQLSQSSNSSWLTTGSATVQLVPSCRAQYEIEFPGSPGSKNILFGSNAVDIKKEPRCPDVDSWVPSTW